MLPNFAIARGISLSDLVSHVGSFLLTCVSSSAAVLEVQANVPPRRLAARLSPEMLVCDRDNVLRSVSRFASEPAMHAEACTGTSILSKHAGGFAPDMQENLESEGGAAFARGSTQAYCLALRATSRSPGRNGRGHFRATGSDRLGITTAPYRSGPSGCLTRQSAFRRDRMSKVSCFPISRVSKCVPGQTLA